MGQPDGFRTFNWDKLKNLNDNQMDQKRLKKKNINKARLTCFNYRS